MNGFGSLDIPYYFFRVFRFPSSEPWLSFTFTLQLSLDNIYLCWNAFHCVEKRWLFILSLPSYFGNLYCYRFVTFDNYKFLLVSINLLLFLLSINFYYPFNLWFLFMISNNHPPPNPTQKPPFTCVPYSSRSTATQYYSRGHESDNDFAHLGTGCGTVQWSHHLL